MDTRIGFGWDSHAFKPGVPLRIGGMTLEHPEGLAGHSDGDVLLHAITDALLGAIAEGDIGMHFPDTDPRWKGADSLVFLRHVCGLVSAAGYRILNVDSTVILERPKLKDFRQAIRESLAAAMSLPPDLVSVKFKTAERVGPVGEGKSAESQAVVLLTQGG